MTNSQQHLKPTQAQLDYLRDLSAATGRSFAWPQTRVEASAEIKELKRAKRTSRAERRCETREIRSDMASRRGDAAAVREEELDGYGSTAAWGEVPHEDD